MNRSVTGFMMEHIGARLERVMLAAISAMSKGTKRPYCWRAWVQGEGYVNDNDGTARHSKEDYLRQLERAAKSEWENCTFVTEWAPEQGMTNPRRGIIALDWNVFPDKLGDLLERMGYDVQWSDTVDVCDGCQRMLQTEPDSYSWKPKFKLTDEGFFCVECQEDDEDEEERS